MKTAVLKRSIEINGKKTSISLEDEFWYGLLEIAAYKKMAVPKTGGANRQPPYDYQSIVRNSHIRVQLLSRACQKTKTSPRQAITAVRIKFCWRGRCSDSTVPCARVVDPRGDLHQTRRGRAKSQERPAMDRPQRS